MSAGRQHFKKPFMQLAITSWWGVLLAVLTARSTCFRKKSHFETSLVKFLGSCKILVYYKNTVSALLKGRHSIKLWGVFTGGILEFSQFLPEKAPKSGLLEQKSGVLLEFCQSGGLIKSGLLFAPIRYIFIHHKSKHDLKLNANT